VTDRPTRPTTARDAVPAHAKPVPPDAPKPWHAKPVPPTVKDQVAGSLGVIKGSLEVLADALILVAERHERNFEIHGTSTVLAGWMRQDIERLAPSIERYGINEGDQPRKLRAALLGGVRGGLAGLIADLTDLAVLAEQVNMSWTVLFQGAKELEDDGMLAATREGRNHTERVVRWIRTEIDHTAPESLAVGADADSSAAASLPKGLDRVAAIPDPIWGPLASGVLILVTGALALLAGRPWLLPSLGPTAVLAGEMPAHPVSRTWNTTVGHAGGLLAGFIGVFLAGAMNDPVVLVDHVLTPGRVLASVIAIALTVLAGAFLRASHPPAAATTLLVSLGSIRTALDASNLLIGVLVIAIAAAMIREVRIHRITPAERMAPRDSLARRFLRRESAG
jgi:hypothetical protein